MASGLGLEATELRLGLPDARGEGEGAKKRGYEETINLKLQLQTPADVKELEEAADNMVKKTPSVKNVAQCGSIVEPEKPPASKRTPICIPFNLVVDLSSWMKTHQCMNSQFSDFGWPSVSCLLE